MTSIHHLLENKGSEIWLTYPDASVYEALQLLAEKNIGALLVPQNGELAGVVSERDYARKVALHGKTSMKTPVQEIMSGNVVTVSPDNTVEEAMTSISATCLYLREARPE